MRHLWPLYPGVSTRDCFRFRPRRFNMLLRFAWDPGYPVFLWVSSKELSRSRCGAKDTKIRLSPGDKNSQDLRTKTYHLKSNCCSGVHRLPTSSIKGVPDSARRCPWIQRQFNSFGDRGPVQYQVFLNDYGTCEARFCAEFRPALVPRSVQKAPLGSQHNFSQIGISSYLTH